MPRPYLQALLAITLVLATSYYLSQGSQPSPEVSAWQEALPKTYLVNTRSSTFDESGALTDVLEADSARYYASRKQSLMDSPRLYSHNAEGDIWSASSETGYFEHKRETLILSKNVSLSNDTHQVLLETQKMKIDFRRNIAVSKAPVVITHGASSTRAEGMIADLDAQTVRLQRNVESVYVQPDS
jgi:LPS export ABC transporter protein LptC